MLPENPKVQKNLSAAGLRCPRPQNTTPAIGPSSPRGIDGSRQHILLRFKGKKFCRWQQRGYAKPRRVVASSSSATHRLLRVQQQTDLRGWPDATLSPSSCIFIGLPTTRQHSFVSSTHTDSVSQAFISTQNHHIFSTISNYDKIMPQ